jgi:putative oxidoreductase
MRSSKDHRPMKTSPEDMNAFWTDDREETPVVRSRPIYDVVALLARCGVGVVFLAHGWQKIQVGVTATGHDFDAMGVPLPTAAAVYATFVELLGGTALILGIGLPVAGTLLFLDMAGAFVFIHAEHGVFVVDRGTPRNGFELVLVLGLASLLFAVADGGRLTLDHRLFGRGGHPRPPGRRRGRRPDETPPPALVAVDAPAQEGAAGAAPGRAEPAGGASGPANTAGATPAPEGTGGGEPAPEGPAGGAPPAGRPGEKAPPARPRRATTGTSRDVRVAGPKPAQEPPAGDTPPAKDTPRTRPRKGPSAKGS